MQLNNLSSWGLVKHTIKFEFFLVKYWSIASKFWFRNYKYKSDRYASIDSAWQLNFSIDWLPWKLVLILTSNAPKKYHIWQQDIGRLGLGSSEIPKWPLCKSFRKAPLNSLIKSIIERRNKPWQFPLIRSYMDSNMSSDVTADWNLIPWNSLWLLYMSIWNKGGQHVFINESQNSVNQFTFLISSLHTIWHPAVKNIRIFNFTSLPMHSWHILSM